MESKAEQKHILVTGGSGYIGGHTLVVLLEAGFRVTVVDNLVNSHPKCIERVEQITGKRVTFHLVDLCDYDGLDLVFSKAGKVDAVIHFAGLKAVGESVNIPIRYYENNLVGTLNLLKAMTKYNCFNIVFSSSATVYGDNPSPIPETASLSSTNPYGRTKLFIEHILKDLAVSADGPKWKIVLLRYFNPVGAHPSGLIGEDPEGIPNNLMPFVAQVAVGRRPHLNVFGNDYPTHDGTGVRDYIHVVDLAEGHLAALQQAVFGSAMTAKNSNCESYNIGRGQGYSVFEMLNAMGEACGRKLPFQIAPRRVGDIAVCFADATKAKNELKWEARRDLKSMVESLWKWQSMNPHGFKGPDAAAAK